METLQAILNRLRLNAPSNTTARVSKTGDYIDFEPEQLDKAAVPIMLANNAEDACEMCLSLSDCSLPSRGWVPVLDMEASRIYGYPYFRWRKCHHLKQAEALKQAEMHLGARFQDRTFETFQVTAENRSAYEKCREYARGLNRQTQMGLLLSGPVGTGKTHLAAAILKHAFGIGLDAGLVSVPKLLEEIKDRFKDGTSRTLADKVTRKFFLVLDDLGAEQGTEWAQKELYLLINTRYEAKLPTVVTTNCDASELVKQTGERTVDRLREMCDPVALGGKSWRGEKRHLQLVKPSREGENHVST